MKFDLFSNPWNAQLKTFFSRNVHQLGALAMIWDCLSKIRRDKASTVVVTSLCLSQPWCPSLLGLFCDDPRIIHPIEDLLVSAQREQNPLCEVAVVVSSV
jgi:hypothetical protein